VARPQKEGLDYFPIDVDIDQDDKLVVPIAKHGMLGFGVIVMLMKEVYRNGYFYPWTEKEKYVFPFKISTDAEKVSEIVNDCINSGFFCKNQYKLHRILTSYGFQKRFLMASNRRKEVTVKPEYLVEKELIQTETELMYAETYELSAISTQKKLKESKVNEIIKDTTATTDNPFRIYENERFGFLTSMLGDKIGEMIDTFTERWVCEAMKEAVYYEVKNLPYVNKILIAWQKTGHDEPWTLPKKEKPSQRNPKSQQRTGGFSNKPSIAIVQTDSSVPTVTAEELEEMRQRALRMDAKFNNKGTG
jgi:DnaD/phage-associated family protein